MKGVKNLGVTEVARSKFKKKNELCQIGAAPEDLANSADVYVLIQRI